MVRLRLAARYNESGDRQVTWLLLEDDRLALWEEDSDDALPLPSAAIAAVFQRYGRPLEDAVSPGEALTLPGGATIRDFFYTPFGYLQPLDYLLYVPSSLDGVEPLAAPAPLVTAALRALGLATLGRGGR